MTSQAPSSTCFYMYRYCLGTKKLFLVMDYTRRQKLENVPWRSICSWWSTQCRKYVTLLYSIIARVWHSLASPRLLTYWKCQLASPLSGHVRQRRDTEPAWHGHVCTILYSVWYCQLYYFVPCRGAKYCNQSVCLFVCWFMCVSTCISQKPRVQISPNLNFLYMLVVALARSSSDGNTICCVLPVQ